MGVCRSAVSDARHVTVRQLDFGDQPAIVQYAGWRMSSCDTTRAATTCEHAKTGFQGLKRFPAQVFIARRATTFIAVQQIKYSPLAGTPQLFLIHSTPGKTAVQTPEQPADPHIPGSRWGRGWACDGRRQQMDSMTGGHRTRQHFAGADGTMPFRHQGWHHATVQFFCHISTGRCFSVIFSMSGKQARAASSACVDG